MVYPGGKEPEGQYLGFLKFCQETGKPHELIHTLENRNIKKGELYLVIWDRDLVWLMKQARSIGLEPGKDIGIISYNDTALKEVVGNGVTTISTDFRLMGHKLATLVNGNDHEHEQIENASSLIVRGTL
jgi:DNA-binding LacI/PurR family transcriptional regulator